MTQIELLVIKPIAVEMKNILDRVNSKLDIEEKIITKKMQLLN